jgi:hypothetical protein
MEITQNAFDQYHQSSFGLGALLAAEFVGRCGPAAIVELSARRDAALEEGDDSGAAGWRYVLMAAEDMLWKMRSGCRG